MRPGRIFRIALFGSSLRAKPRDPGASHLNRDSPTSGTRLFAIVRVPDRTAKPAIELGAVKDDFLRMDRIDGAQRDREIAGIST